MEKKTIPGIDQMSPQEIVDFLEANCYMQEDNDIEVPLTSIEVGEYQKVVADLSIDLSVYETEKKKFLAKQKEETKPMKKQLKEAISTLGNGFKLVEGRLFGMANHEDQVMEFYTIDGVFHSSRRLTAEERQMKIRHVNRNAS